MLRSLLAILGSVFVGANTIRLMQTLINDKYPFPEEINRYDQDAIMAFYSSLPSEFYYWIFATHILGGFITGILAAKIAKVNKKVVAYLAIGLIIIGTLISLFTFPHPTWLKIADPILMFICGAIGAEFVTKQR